MISLLLGSINPGHSDVLKDDDDGEWQGGRIVIKHGDKVVSGALDEQQPHEECKDTAANYREPGGRCVCGGAQVQGGWDPGDLGGPNSHHTAPNWPAAYPLHNPQAQEMAGS